MRALDDIVFGFLIFFAIDRLIRLFSNGIVEPWAETKTRDKNTIENWKTGAELVAITITGWLLVQNRHVFKRLNTS